MNANDSFEEAAAAFYKATGMLMPGKSIPAACGWTEEQEERRQAHAKTWRAAIEYMQKVHRREQAEAEKDARDAYRQGRSDERFESEEERP